MIKTDSKLERLLRTAASAPNELPKEMPFGFDTRVLARWRANASGELVSVARLLRRVVLLSLGVIAMAGAATYRELSQTDELSESFTDEYAIADSAIEVAFDQ